MNGRWGVVMYWCFVFLWFYLLIVVMIFLLVRILWKMFISGCRLILCYVVYSGVW